MSSQTTFDILDAAARDEQGATIEGADARLAYIFGGSATFTLKSLTSGAHYTYRVAAAKVDEGKPAVHFVSVLTGSEAYTYLGTCFAQGPMRLTQKSHLAPGASAVKAFQWLQRNPASTEAEVWHDGTCARCGRQLTDPESIATGLGPVCRTK